MPSNAALIFTGGEGGAHSKIEILRATWTFSHGPEKLKKSTIFVYFPRLETLTICWVLNFPWPVDKQCEAEQPAWIWPIPFVPTERWTNFYPASAHLSWPCLICSGAWIAPRPWRHFGFFFDFLVLPCPFLGSGGCWKWSWAMAYRAPSSFNMSSYRAIWTHLRSNSVLVVVFIDLILHKLLIWTSTFQATWCSTLRKAEDMMPRDC